jgi:hypothetical protein
MMAMASSFTIADRITMLAIAGVVVWLSDDGQHFELEGPEAVIDAAVHGALHLFAVGHCRERAHRQSVAFAGPCWTSP